MFAAVLWCVVLSFTGVLKPTSKLYVIDAKYSPLDESTHAYRQLLGTDITLYMMMGQHLEPVEVRLKPGFGKGLYLCQVVLPSLVYSKSILSVLNDVCICVPFAMYRRFLLVISAPLGVWDLVC